MKTFMNRYAEVIVLAEHIPIPISYSILLYSSLTHELLMGYSVRAGTRSSRRSICPRTDDPYLVPAQGPIITINRKSVSKHSDPTQHTNQTGLSLGLGFVEVVAAPAT